MDDVCDVCDGVAPGVKRRVAPVAAVEGGLVDACHVIFSLCAARKMQAGINWVGVDEFREK